MTVYHYLPADLCYGPSLLFTNGNIKDFWRSFRVIEASSWCEVADMHGMLWRHNCNKPTLSRCVGGSILWVREVTENKCIRDLRATIALSNSTLLSCRQARHKRSVILDHTSARGSQASISLIAVDWYWKTILILTWQTKKGCGPWCNDSKLQLAALRI